MRASRGDIYGSGYADEVLSVKTAYEERFLGMGLPITYIRFRLDGQRDFPWFDWEEDENSKRMPKRTKDRTLSPVFSFSRWRSQALTQLQECHNPAGEFRIVHYAGNAVGPRAIEINGNHRSRVVAGRERNRRHRRDGEVLLATRNRKTAGFS